MLHPNHKLISKNLFPQRLLHGHFIPSLALTRKRLAISRKPFVLTFNILTISLFPPFRVKAAIKRAQCRARFSIVEPSKQRAQWRKLAFRHCRVATEVDKVNLEQRAPSKLAWGWPSRVRGKRQPTTVSSSSSTSHISSILSPAIFTSWPRYRCRCIIPTFSLSRAGLYFFGFRFTS